MALLRQIQLGYLLGDSTLVFVWIVSICIYTHPVLTFMDACLNFLCCFICECLESNLILFVVNLL